MIDPIVFFLYNNSISISTLLTTTGDVVTDELQSKRLYACLHASNRLSNTRGKGSARNLETNVTLRSRLC